MQKQKKTKRKSLGGEIFEGLIELHESLVRGEKVEERFTVRKVKLDLKPLEYDAASVRVTRARLGVSQALFAQLLGASVDLVQSWEQGARKPSQMACRLLDEMNLDPARWIKRLKDAMREAESLKA